jgi:hypothetical protein
MGSTDGVRYSCPVQVRGTIQVERDELYRLLAYAVVCKHRQSDGASSPRHVGQVEQAILRTIGVPVGYGPASRRGMQGGHGTGADEPQR